MSDYTVVEEALYDDQGNKILDALIVDDDGVIIEGGERGLGWVVAQRHYAKECEDAWGSRKAMLDTIIKKQQEKAKATYDDVMVSVRGGTYGRLDGEQLSDLVYERYTDPDDLFNAFAALVASATGIRKHRDKDNPERRSLEDFPELAGLVEKATSYHEKKPWVETRRLASPPPPARILQDAMGEPA